MHTCFVQVPLQPELHHDRRLHLHVVLEEAAAERLGGLVVGLPRRVLTAVFIRDSVTEVEMIPGRMRPTVDSE